MQPKDEGAFERAREEGQRRPTRRASSSTRSSTAGRSSPTSRRRSTRSSRRATPRSTRSPTDKTFSSRWARRDDGIFRAYVNGASVMAAARKFIGPECPRLPSKKLGTLDWLLMTLRAKSDGIAWDTTVHGTPGKAFKNVHGPRLRTAACRSSCRPMRCSISRSTARRGCSAGSVANPDPAAVRRQGPWHCARGRFGTILAGRERALRSRRHEGMSRRSRSSPRPDGGVDGAAALDRVLNRFSKELGARRSGRQSRVSPRA